MNNEKSTQLERLSDWICSLQFESLPPRVARMAQLQVLDALAAVCSGARSTIGQRLRRALGRMESGGPCTAIMLGEQWSPDNAIYWHSSMINALELDNFAFLGHFTESSFSVALAVAEFLKKDGRDFLLAMVAAQEAAGRISAHLSSGPQQGHMRAFAHRVAGATAASKLLGLSQDATARALAIALSMPEFPLYAASYSADTKVICTALPAVEGMKAAFHAAEGVDGPLDIIEHPLGFWAYFSYVQPLPDIWGKIGQSWITDTLSFKKYATCAYAQGPVNAAVKAYEEGGYLLEDIRKVEVFCPMTTVVLEKFSEPHYQAGITPVNTHFSACRSVAATLACGPLTGDFFADGNFEKQIPSFLALAERTHLVHDWELSIQALKGIDKGLEGAGKPGPLSMGNADTVLKKFKASHGSRPMLQWSDLGRLMRASRDNRNYFLWRMSRSLRAKLPFWAGAEARNQYRASEGDLQALSFPLGGRVRLYLNDGRELEYACHIPSGFAGDPHREQVVEEKYYREVVPVWGEAGARAIERAASQLASTPVTEFTAALQRVSSQSAKELH